MNCKSHPDKPAARECAGCGEGFCEECLSEYKGKEYCAACRKAEVALATSDLMRGTSDVARMKRSLIGCSVALLALVLIPMILLVYPCFRLGDVGRCRANLERVYKALAAYAKDNDRWFPPENNDLSPVFSSKHLKDSNGGLFRCPGAMRRATGAGKPAASPRSARTFPPEMSYLYQGGLGLPVKGGSPEPVMWDRSSLNHRGKGINVLHTDGSVSFETKRLSRFQLRRIDTHQ